LLLISAAFHLLQIVVKPTMFSLEPQKKTSLRDLKKSLERNMDRKIKSYRSTVVKIDIDINEAESDPLLDDDTRGTNTMTEE
jgi:hypothetical protein